MNDYDFIMNNQPKRKGFSFNQGSMLSKIILLGGGAVVLIIAIIIFSSLINSGKPSATSYIPITVYQEELIRVLENRNDLSDQSLLPQYTTLFLAVNSDYQESLAYLARNGVEITPEQRSPYYYFELESDLETAASANRFDEEFKSYVEKAVADYSRELLALEPTQGQAPLLEQAKQNIIYYNGRPSDSTEE